MGDGCSVLGNCEHWCRLRDSRAYLRPDRHIHSIFNSSVRHVARFSCGIQIGNNATIDTLIHAVDVNDVQLLSSVAVMEVLTVASIMFLDFQLCGQVLDKYIDGVSIFELVSKLDFRMYRVPARAGILMFYVFLMVLIGVSITRML